MACRGTELAESAYSPWLSLGLFPFAHLLRAPRVPIQKAEECQVLQAVSETLWELLLEGSRQEETLLGNERTEAGSNQGSSLFTFYAGSSRGSSCLSPGC